MQLDHDQLRQLLALLGDSDIQELRLEGDDFRLEVRRNLPSAAPPPPVMAPPPAAAPPTVPSAAPAGVPPAPSAPPPPPASVRSDLQAVTAPMVGTFYRSSAPGEPVRGDRQPCRRRPAALHPGGDEADERARIRVQR